MRFLKKTVLPVFLAGTWISMSEFLRNEILLKSYWINHYNHLGPKFPSEPVNGAVWGIWSFLFAILIALISRKFYLMQTVLISWFAGFILMWVVTGNLGVLPSGLLVFAVPLSLLETFIASVIIYKFYRKNYVFHS